MVTSAPPRWYVKQMTHVQDDDAFTFTVITDTPVHLWMRITDREPWVHLRTRIRRGLAKPLIPYFCFTVYHDNEQSEPGDTLIHTFVKPPWYLCETRWFYFHGTIAGVPSPSTSPIYSKHSTLERWLTILNEPWTVTTLPPPFTVIIEELWSELHTPPSWTEVINEPWTS